jgi:hypothetical protein
LQWAACGVHLKLAPWIVDFGRMLDIKGIRGMAPDRLSHQMKQKLLNQPRTKEGKFYDQA